MSINVVLDSTVYKQTPQMNSSLFMLLRKMCRINTIKLYIPWIIEREYLTWIDEKIDYAYKTILQAMYSLNRLLPQKNNMGFDFVSQFTGTTMKGRKAESFMNWERFKQDTGAVEIPISSDHGLHVMSSYFDGSSPFSKKKNREDIPDGFIYYAILEILKEEKQLYFVSADKRFTEYLLNIPEVIIAENIVSFFQIKEIANSTGVTLSGNSIDSFRNILLFYRDELNSLFCSCLSAEIDLDEESSHLIEPFMQQPLTNVDATINELNLDMENIVEIQPLTFILPFSGQLQLELFYCIEAGSLSQLGKERIEKLISRDENEIGYYDVIEAFPCNFNGSYSIVLSEKDPKLWKDVQSELQLKLESMELNWSF